MTITSDQAIQQLIDHPSDYATPAALRNLIEQLDVTGQGSSTVLYSGDLGDGVSANQVAIAMAAGNENIRIVDSTEAAKFLDISTNQVLVDTLEQIFGENELGSDPARPGTPANKFLYDVTFDGKLGAWATTSERFVSLAEGDVRVIAPFSVSTRVLAQVEIPTLLSNPNITSVEGIPIGDLERLASNAVAGGMDSISVLNSTISAISQQNVSSLYFEVDNNGKILVNADGIPTAISTNHYFEGSTIDGTTLPVGASSSSGSDVMSQGIENGKIKPSTPERIGEAQFGVDQIKQFSAEHIASLESVESAGRILNKLGVLGDALALGLAVASANAALDAGDSASAVEIMLGWAAEFGGGVAGGLAAAELVSSVLAPLYLTGPAGAIIAGGLTLLAGFAGGIIGGELVKETVNDLFQSALAFVPRRDPIVLDLDGDGIETTPADGTVLFDHDGDGISNATGWIHSDDGILVLDRNGDGIINDGRELFGDNTVLLNGEMAANGFEALADIDSNKDDVINTLDSQFSNLRIWRDLNQDGVSQESELQTLDVAGIQSISTNYVDAQLDIGNENVAIGQGSFIRTDGTVGETGSTAALNLAENNFYREFSDAISIPEELQSLPDMKGSGAVRDLLQAATINTNLAALLAQYASATTREEQMTLLDSLINEWANSAEFTDWVERLESSTIGNLMSARDIEFRIEVASANSVEYFDSEDLMVGSFSNDGNAETLAMIRILEIFNGTCLLDFGIEDNTNDKFTLDVTSGNISFAKSLTSPTAVYIDQNDFAFNADQQALLLNAYASLQDSVYTALLFQTRLKPALETMSLKITDEGNLAFDFSGLDTFVTDKLVSGDVNALIDVLELLKSDQTKALISLGWTPAWEIVDDALTSLSIEQQQELSDAGIIFNRGSSSVSAADDIYMTVHQAGSTALTFNGGDGVDIVFGSNVSDSLSGAEENDFLFGKSGADTLSGGEGDDQLSGGEGDDKLYGHAGNDILEGGVGNETLYGGSSSSDGAGADTYYFSKGDGQDVIYDKDLTADVKDTLIFRAGISASDVTAKRDSSDNLILQIANTSDQILIYDFFREDAAGGYAIESIVFNDATVWDVETVKLKLLNGTGADETVYGYQSSDDVISGGDGIDTVYGYGGNDSLKGDGGVDTLRGGDGNDTLEGGLGNDALYGGSSSSDGMGADTYYFSKGDGQDRIYDRDSTAGVADKLIFRSGISPTEVTAKRDSYDNLVLSISGTTDQITVDNFFNSDATGGYALENIEFADGTQWDLEAIKLKVLQGTTAGETLKGYAASDDTIYAGAGNDTLNGYAGADTLVGEAGNDSLNGGDGNDSLNGGDGADTLMGNAGNDTLEGGLGNDALYGGSSTSDGTGADIYYFSKGDGQDVIYDKDLTAGVTDRLIFRAGVTASEVTAKRDSSDNLILQISNTTDQITINDFFTSEGTGGFAIEQIEFADGTVLDLNAIKLKALEGTSASETLYGHSSNDTLNGNAGDDILYGQAGTDVMNGGSGIDKLYGGDADDTLNGGDGVDTLYGQTGNDGLEGGLGNDLLYGGSSTSDGTGADTYYFSKGDGQDTIYDKDNTAGVTDKLILRTGVSASEVTAKRDSYDNLVLSISGTTDQITINNFFNSDTAGGYAIENIEFADGTRWDIDALKLKVLQGTTAGETLKGYASDDTISGGGGNDTLHGNGGLDSLQGEAGNDGLNGGDGNDSLNGGEGTDTLVGNAGNDTLEGGLGNDVLYGGDSTSSSGAGADTYYFSKGDGQDVIYDKDLTTGVTDKLVFRAGVTASEVTAKRDSSDNLILQISNTTDQITINDFFTSEGTGGFAIEQIEFADGTVLDLNAIKLKALEGTSASETLYGHSSNDTLNGNAGDDILYGQAGTDAMNGGSGIDKLYGGDADDTLNGGDGVDTLYGQTGNDGLEGGLGNDVLYGGSSTSDGTGADTYYFSKGDGQDVIYDKDSTAGVTDKLVFRSGVAPSDVTAKRDSSANLVLTIAGTTDQITVSSFFTSDAAGGYTLESIEFADGTFWDLETIKLKVLQGTGSGETLYGYATSNDTIYAGAGNDTLYGYAGADTLFGEAGTDMLNGGDGNDSLTSGDGNDTLVGNAGDDTLEGGLGNDVLYGGDSTSSSGAGADTYYFSKGDGQDTIYDKDSTAGVTDKLIFRVGVTASEVTAKRDSSDNLILQISNTTDQITVNDYFVNDGNGGFAIEKIEFSDGTLWDVEAVKLKALEGTSASETLYGHTSADTMNGNTGDDFLYGQAGADTLNGGSGIDKLYGGDANDSLNGGDGNDTLYGQNGNDGLEGGLGNDVL